MTTEALKEYLGIVVDMEKNIYHQERNIQKIVNEIESLGQRVHREEPDLPTPYGKASNPIAVAICGVVGAGLLWAIPSVGTGLAIFFGVVGFFLILAVLMEIPNILKNEKRNKENQESYERAMREYQHLLLEDEQRVFQESIRKAVLENELRELKDRNESSKRSLQKIYSANIIFPKYRNFVMVCSLYEYVCAGRCATLEGHEGAYNILENEIRLDRIITQLDEIIEDLNMIQKNQYMLYASLQETNAQMVKLVESTDQMMGQLQAMQSQNALQGEELNAQIKKLQKSSELTAYHAERTQRELEYMNRMDYLTGRNDGPFNNLPPA